MLSIRVYVERDSKKCVKICDGCSVGAYGDINYEFLHNHGDEFMTYMTCKGDATGAYDFDKIDSRYGADELLTQHDLNHHIDLILMLVVYNLLKKILGIQLQVECIKLVQEDNK